MSAKEFRTRSPGELRVELLKLRKEQFSLRVQRAMGQGAKPSEFSRVRKSIARLKTVLHEKQTDVATPKTAGGK
jgi:large subunit ribosomal protein L29